MPTPRFYELFVSILRRLTGDSPDAASAEVMQQAFLQARAQTGGETAAANRAGADGQPRSADGELGAGAHPPVAPPVAAASGAAGAIRLGELSASDVNDLPDEVFAYIEPGGSKDAEGKTAPRSLRHFPVPDAPHVRAALSRAPQSPFGDRAMPKIKAAAEKFGVTVSAEDGYPPVNEPVYTELRLDAGDGLPLWQVYHAVGDHGTHPKWGPIVFTKADGDAIIRNHAAGVLGRQVPLDFRHGTGQDGEAGGWVERFSWGRRGEGLTADPSGSGSILYAKLEYNDVGRAKLGNEHYRHQSPEYDRNFKGQYGATALALAATNNPFLRGLRTLQGREQAPVMLDAAVTEEEPTMPPDQNDPAQLHMPPGMAPGGAPPAGGPPAPPRPPAPPAAPAAQGGSVFAAGAKCPNCGTTMAGGEKYCSNCGMAAPAAGPNPQQPQRQPVQFSQGGDPMPPENPTTGGAVQLDAVTLQAQLAESQRRQAALEAQQEANAAIVVGLQLDARRSTVNAFIDKSIYDGTPPPVAKLIGRLTLACDALPSSTVKLTDAADAPDVSLADGLKTLLEMWPKVPLGRRTSPSLESPPPSADTVEQDKAYAEAVKAKAAELSAERNAHAAPRGA